MSSLSEQEPEAFLLPGSELFGRTALLGELSAALGALGPATLSRVPRWLFSLVRRDEGASNAGFALLVFSWLKGWPQFGRFLERKCRALGLPPWMGSLTFPHLHAWNALVLQPWRGSWAALAEPLRAAVAAGISERQVAVVAQLSPLVHHFDRSLDLSTGRTLGQLDLVLLERCPGASSWLPMRMFDQYRKALQGLTRDPTSLDDEGFSEAECLAALERAQNQTYLAMFWVLKLELAFTFEAVGDARLLLPKCAVLVETVQLLPLRLEYHFYAFLTRARLYPLLDGAELARLRREMLRDKRCVEQWSRFNPQLRFRYLILAAEWARLHLEFWKTSCLLRDAAEAAAQQGGSRDVALVAELAGRFYLGQGRVHAAGCFFLDAEQAYQVWGATAKVEELGRRQAKSLNLLRLPEQPTLPEESLSASLSHSGTLDLDTVIKTSMVIASEINYEELLLKMMNITIESAGAQMGALISHEGESLFIEATSRLGEASTGKLECIPLNRATFLSQKLVRYTFRSGKTAVLGNAQKDPVFSKDPYLASGLVKSVLCTPIRQKDRVVGVLYLENNLVEDAFSEDRVNLLHMLTAQAAISMENARLFAQSKRNERAVRQLNQDLANLNEALERRVQERTHELHAVQTELVTKAHHAGMAEIATSVLHNVGNILNSVITSCQLIHETVGNSKLDGMLMANQMLREKMPDIQAFILYDPKGLNLLKYYLQLDKHLLKERETVIGNVTRLMGKVESIREVIMAQQSYASGGFQDEQVELSTLIDDALGIMNGSIERNGVEVVKEYEPVRHLLLPKNKIIHLLVNLIKNAVEAMAGVDVQRRRLILRMEAGLDFVHLDVIDSGTGIPPEHLERIFEHGYTTKTHGHGFGLHSCASSMREIGGRIDAHSLGLGQGATFSLFFPAWRMATKFLKDDETPET